MKKKVNKAKCFGRQNNRNYSSEWDAAEHYYMRVSGQFLLPVIHWKLYKQQYKIHSN